MSTVLVTGGSGFLAGHAIRQLLAAGHRVRTTLRQPQREAALRAMLHRAGTAPDGRLACVAADLGGDAGWAEAATGCDHVLHMASPFPAKAPAHEDELIVPAREGTLRVLRAARDAGVQRVVMTSSFAAIGYGHPAQAAPFDERSWTDLGEAGGKVSAYARSKTLAERAAWDFVATRGSGLALAVVNPVGIFGPVLGPDDSASIALVRRMLDGTMPACPKLFFGIVDVRDAAELHLRAMTAPQAAGQRFIAAAGAAVSLLDVARMLRRRLGEHGARVPTREVPNWLIRLAALGNSELRQLVPELGKIKQASHAKAASLLGWSPRPAEEAIVAAAQSLVGLGLLKAG